MNDLVPFAFSGQQVRVVLGEDGSPWFVAADVCGVLGYQHTGSALRSLREGQKGVRRMHTPGGAQDVTVLSESGLYRLTMRSDRPEADAFQDWVTDDVLPAIRKTGSYAAPAVPDLSTPAGVLAMAEQLTATARALVAASEKVAELEPKAEVADKLLTADGDMSVGDAAKALTRAGVTVGANRLFALLEAWKWVYRAKGDGRWRVMQTAIESGHMSVLPQSHYHPRTGVLVLDPPQPRLTPKGLARLLREHGVEKAEAASLAEQMVAGAEV